MQHTTNTKTAPVQFAVFDIEEVELGLRLGSGGFSDVYEVKSFRQVNTRNQRRKHLHRGVRDTLTRLAPDGHYAIKFLKQELVEDPEGFDAAARDLQLEADILSRLDHENILKIRGWASAGLEAYSEMDRHDAYFLILDRLQKTLAQRIDEWYCWTSGADSATKDMKTRNKLLLEQLELALDIATGLEYLHEEGYIYRDLKPDNIGLDSRSRGKLFDFGLARKLPEGNTDDRFEMTGKIGTPRYMAPEVYQRRWYNAKADVYSFAHVLWEMLTFEKPYTGFTKSMHRHYTVELGVRPEIYKSWPPEIQKFLERAWHRDMAKRPTMKEVRDVLEIEVAKIQAKCRNERPKSQTTNDSSSGRKSSRRGYLPRELQILPNAAALRILQ